MERKDGGEKTDRVPSVHPSPATSAGLGLDVQLEEGMRQERLSRKAEEVGEGPWEGRGCCQPQPFPTRPPEGGSWEKPGGKRCWKESQRVRGDPKEATGFSRIFPR